jgi:predicted PhzF superfamily epimerase YddE/YHI9
LQRGHDAQARVFELWASSADSQVDVFTATPFGGNPVAVVLDSDGLSTSEMQCFALSEK